MCIMSLQIKVIIIIILTPKSQNLVFFKTYFHPKILPKGPIIRARGSANYHIIGDNPLQPEKRSKGPNRKGPFT